MEKESLIDKKEETIDKDDIKPINQDVTDNMTEELERFRQKFMPYQRYIMIIGIIILILLVVFLGYAYGGLKVCADLDGLLDKNFKCHLNSTVTPIYNYPITETSKYDFNINDIS